MGNLVLGCAVGFVDGEFYDEVVGSFEGLFVGSFVGDEVVGTLEGLFVGCFVRRLAG